jgi:hypothetical protein
MLHQRVAQGSAIRKEQARGWDLSARGTSSKLGVMWGGGLTTHIRLLSYTLAEEGGVLESWMSYEVKLQSSWTPSIDATPS